MGTRQILRWSGACCPLVGLGITTTSAAGAATARTALPSTARSTACTGTEASPGVLTGTYPSGAVVTGYCEVDGGAAVVDGSLTLATGATLDATFAKDDVAGTGTSSLTVSGNIKVAGGATLVMGCEPGYLACSDDPGGTLSGDDHIGGNLVAKGALGVVVHASTVTGSVNQSAGGGGVTCADPASGLFARIGFGVYSDYEDDTIGGNLHVTGLLSCWIGIIRNTVAGNFVDSGNTFADPDADGALQNTVGRSVACAGNTPAVQYGDSGATPNVVTGRASGECAFTLASGRPVSVKA
jgi:hypothetical protein